MNTFKRGAFTAALLASAAGCDTIKSLTEKEPLPCNSSLVTPDMAARVKNEDTDGRVRELMRTMNSCENVGEFLAFATTQQLDETQTGTPDAYALLHTAILNHPSDKAIAKGKAITLLDYAILEREDPGSFAATLLANSSPTAQSAEFLKYRIQELRERIKTVTDKAQLEQLNQDRLGWEILYVGLRSKAVKDGFTR